MFWRVARSAVSWNVVSDIYLFILLILFAREFSRAFLNYFIISE